MSKHTCYECENFFTSSFCGYDACYCKIHGSLDVDQHERHPDTTGATCRDIMTPTMESAMMHEINQQCLEADKRFSLDLDTMVIWTLYQCYGWREKRLHDFYLAMAKEHRRMREFYEMDDLYPERYKLKEKGIDLEKWQEEVLHNGP